MAGLGQERGDKRLREGRKRSILRGADTIITVETGFNSAPTRAKTLQQGERGKPRRPSVLNQRRLNRRVQRRGFAALPKIDAVATPDVGRDIAANEEAIRKSFGTGGFRGGTSRGRGLTGGFRS